MSPVDPVIVVQVAQRLERAVREAGSQTTGDGRVSEAVAAALLGLAPATLANRRAYGTGPSYHRLGLAGFRISYSLQDLAAWICRHRVE